MTKLSEASGHRGLKPGFSGPFESKNRPALNPRRAGGILFHDTGPTGWGRIRRLGDYKGSHSESNFDHLNDKFVGPGEA